MTSPATQQLIDAVRASTADTPYVVTETANGFDVSLDIVNAEYFALFYKENLSKAWTYHVKIEDESAKVLSITDDARSVTWRAGAEGQGDDLVPVLGGSVTRELGRKNEKSFQKTFAIGTDGAPGKVVDYSFDSAEGREHVRGPAKQLGWSEQRGAAEKVGLVVALGTVGLLVVAAIVVALVLALR